MTDQTAETLHVFIPSARGMAPGRPALDKWAPTTRAPRAQVDWNAANAEAGTRACAHASTWQQALPRIGHEVQGLGPVILRALWATEPCSRISLTWIRKSRLEKGA